MKNKIKINQKNIYKSGSILGIFLMLLFFAIKVKGQVATTDAETQDKIDELNKRAEVYRQIIDIKKKQSETLGDKISAMDSSMKEVKSQIRESEDQIDTLNNQIGTIEQQISEKNTQILKQKKILAQIMQSYYQISQSSPVAIYLSDDNIASYMLTKDRMSQTGDKIEEIIERLNDLKAEIQSQGDELNKKKGDIVSAHQDLQDKNNNLESIKEQQRALLVQTQGEQARYSQLLERVQEQKDQLLDIDQYFAASGLSADSYPKPDSKYFASTDWYFSQKDSRWANTTIGNTKTLMKSYGCAVTAVAMVFKNHGGSITPGSLAKQSIFSGDLINWPNEWKNPNLSISSEGKSHKNINWSSIDAALKNNQPVIVYIGRSNGTGGHYVVIHHKDSKGNYVVHDPYFGPNIFLNTTRALVGAMGSSSSTYMDQMIIYN